MQYGKPLADVADATNIDTGLVVAVYVEQDGDNVYFVDKKPFQMPSNIS